MTTDSSSTLVEIGVVGRAHGIAGAVHIFLHNPDSDILSSVESVVLEDMSGRKVFRIVEMRRGAKMPVARFEGVSTRTEAEKLKGAKIVVPRDALPSLSEEEFYVADLIGLEVWNDENRIGVVTSSRPQGEIEMITVTGESVSVEVPLVEDFVVKVDIPNRKIFLTDVGLLPSSPVKRAFRKP